MAALFASAGIVASRAPARAVDPPGIEPDSPFVEDGVLIP